MFWFDLVLFIVVWFGLLCFALLCILLICFGLLWFGLVCYILLLFSRDLEVEKDLVKKKTFDADIHSQIFPRLGNLRTSGKSGRRQKGPCTRFQQYPSLKIRNLPFAGGKETDTSPSYSLGYFFSQLIFSCQAGGRRSVCVNKG